MNDQKNISAAFVKAQKGFAPALKNSMNPHFKSKYADLGACLEAVMDSLNNSGIALVQKTHLSDSGVIVETVFVHESGETMSAGQLHVPAAKQDPQGYGSALSYARRYSLMTACGIAPEDDDGNAASKTSGQQEKPIDNSLKGRADRIKAGVASGDTEGAAQYLANLPEPEMKSLWALFDVKTREKLTAKWPVAA